MPKFFNVVNKNKYVQMNKLIKFSGIVAIALISFSLNAQVIEFDATTHDFGEISEELGTAVHNFIFTNKGDKPLVVTAVKPGCGCTVADWTKEPVKPGESGTITANYKTSPGQFNKSMTVTTNGSSKAISLYIKGNVLRKPEDLNATHLQTLAKLKVKNKGDLVFPLINSQQTSVSKFIEVANTSDSDINISFENCPEYLLVAAIPQVLQPNKKGQITVSVIGEKAKTFGWHSNEITVVTNDVKEKIKIIDIVAEKIDLKENSPVPACEVEKTFIDLGATETNKANGMLSIKNVGNADLIVKTFTTDNPLFSPVSKKDLKIKAGKTGEFKLSASGLVKGENAATVYLCTNDPLKPLLQFSVRVVVN